MKNRVKMRKIFDNGGKINTTIDEPCAVLVGFGTKRGPDT